MKALIVAFALLLPATAGAQVTEGSPGRSGVQFDGVDAIVSVACAKLEGDCSGQVSVAAVDVPGVVLGGPVPYVVNGESSERVRVPLSEAGRRALASARQVVVIVDALSAVATV